MTVICCKCGKIQDRSFSRGYRLADDACNVCQGRLTPAKRDPKDFSRFLTVAEMQSKTKENTP